MVYENMSVAEDSSCLGCDVVSQAKYLIIQRFVESSSWTT